MALEYNKVEIAATSEEEARAILDTLLAKRLVAGGHIMSGHTRHWWRGKIDAAVYHYVIGYTVSGKRDAIIAAVRNVSSEEVPGVVFFAIDHANSDFLAWIEEESVS